MNDCIRALDKVISEQKGMGNPAVHYCNANVPRNGARVTLPGRKTPNVNVTATTNEEGYTVWYSYHTPVVITNPKGRVIAVLKAHSYSATTMKHCKLLTGMNVDQRREFRATWNPLADSAYLNGY